jgi:hypothetical protein
MDDTRRIWEIQNVYLPIPGRVLGGIRVKLRDQKEFVTFCNQRDLEVLIGMYRPGDFCLWAGGPYLEPGDEGWCGLCCDEDDLVDDLYDREMFWRAQIGGVLTQQVEILTPQGPSVQNVEIQRRVHLDKNNDNEELYVLLGDYDQETGMYPDTKFETVERRWMRAERRKLLWSRT